VADTIGADGGPPGLEVPLRVGDADLGRLEVAGLSGARDPDLETTVAAGLALTLRSAQLLDGLQDRARELERQVRQLHALQEVARAVGRATDLHGVAAVIAREARRVVRADGAAVVMAPPGGDLAVVGSDGSIHPTAVMAGQAALHGRGPRTLPGGQAAVPVAGRQGEVPAALVALRTGTVWTDEDLDRLTGLAEVAGVAIATVRLVDDLRAEQHRRERLAAAIVDAQEAERRRVAEDLHDGPVQVLTGLGLMLDAARGSAATDGPDGVDGDELGRAAEAARAAVGEIRRAIHDLHPMALEELGFTAAVRGSLERVLLRGVAVSTEGLEAADRLSGEVRTAAFRIVQEAVANAGRHARAGTVRVTGRVTGRAVELEVRYDGVGFDPGRVGGFREGHLGLATMRERALLAGAELTIHSGAGGGTRVRVRFPLHPAG
jgi:signal transduction histidine kinase